MLRVFAALVAIGSWAAHASDNPAQIAAYRLEDGRYIPDEPYRDGEPKATGLQYPFPRMVSVDTNPITPEKAHLGKLLYFDPIVSGDNTMSCATCHHPDFGFADGRATGMGVGGAGVGPERKGGQVLSRNTPSIWNAAYNHLQYWDGRAKDLEEQSTKPITANIEMNEKPENLVKELRAIPEYVELFSKAFDGQGEESITFDNVSRAIASFERTVLTFNSRFDRYTQGDANALTQQEKRGLSAFRSVKTRCFECHRFPHFADDTFRIIGVPRSRHDPGRAGVPGQGPDGAFKVPTLRNVELTAPYMHNGHFKTLEEVVQFYADGGGRAEANPIEGIDDKIGKFPLTEQEKADLLAFLKSLTDTSLLPEAPTRVPSGLPVVAVKSKPVPAPPAVMFAKSVETSAPSSKPSVVGGLDVSRSRSFQVAAADDSKSATSVSATFTVKPGQSIQAAVDRAQAGDRVEVMPGVYKETVVIDKAGITLRGVIEAGERAVLDGEGKLGDAVQCSGADFTIEGFLIRNYTGNGVVTSKTTNVTFRNLNIHEAGLYGVYPVECTGVLIEGCVVSGISDAGLYVGQSRDIIVRNNEVYLSVAGIEIENSVNALVENNSVHHNTAGILVFCAPNNPSKVASDCKVIQNRIWSNNTPNFGKPGTTVSTISAGIGIVVMAADRTEVTQNIIEDNGSYAITVSSLFSSKLPGDLNHQLDIEPNSDETWIHNNTFVNNGTNPSEQYKRDYPDVPPGDLFWDGTGEKNQWQESNELKQVPPDLIEKNGGAHTNVVHFL